MSQEEYKKVDYSDRYETDEYIYRHVRLPRSLARLVPCNRLMTEQEWRSSILQLQMSKGWEQYMIHRPEPHILLFRMPKALASSTQGNTPSSVPQDSKGKEKRPPQDST